MNTFKLVSSIKEEKLDGYTHEFEGRMYVIEAYGKQKTYDAVLKIFAEKSYYKNSDVKEDGTITLMNIDRYKDVTIYIDLKMKPNADLAISTDYNKTVSDVVFFEEFDYMEFEKKYVKIDGFVVYNEEGIEITKSNDLSTLISYDKRFVDASIRIEIIDHKEYLFIPSLWCE